MISLGLEAALRLGCCQDPLFHPAPQREAAILSPFCQSTPRRE